MSIHFTVNANDSGTPFPHYWELCVGSCHATMGLRADWREQLKKAHDELGFQYVRFHGLLDYDMSVCVPKDLFGRDPGTRYSFYNVDQVFDFLLSIGMKPFVELGFMPDALASGSRTVFNYKANITPPKDYGAWADLVDTLTRHCVARYGIDEVRSWFFEVWNEPNLAFFWAGTQQEYFMLYESAARAIKAVDGELRVGGPATSMNDWIDDFVAFCRANAVPVDFVSTHNYPTDQRLWEKFVLNNEPLTLEAMFAVIQSKLTFDRRDIMTAFATRAKEEACGLPLYYTEWNARQGDGPADAAFIAKILADNQGLVEGYSFWTFSDLFEEGGQPSMPYHNGFGLMNIHGIPKPAYRLFEILHNMGTTRLPVKQTGEGNTELLAVRDGDGVSLLAYNFSLEGQPAQVEEITVHIADYTAGKAYEIKLDPDHCNPEQAWINMGKPEYPDTAELNALYKAAEVTRMPLQPREEDGASVVSFTIQPQSCVYIKLYLHW